jgi:hypothetical protein
MHQHQHHHCHSPGPGGCGCHPCCGGTPMVSPYELSVDSGGSTAQALVGGTTTVHLSLEYLVDAGASSPSIKVTTASNGTTSTWQETAPASGYTVKHHFLNIPPGTTVTVDTSGAAARLRWCETFCC